MILLYILKICHGYSWPLLIINYDINISICVIKLINLTKKKRKKEKDPDAGKY